MKATERTFNMGRVRFWTIFALTLSIAFLFWCFKEWAPNVMAKDQSYEVVNRWELPTELREISGIDWLDDNTIASVQDEDGIIFIFDLNTGKITKKIEFGGPGDYEGLALYKNDAYVLESKGTITEINNFQSAERKIKRYQTIFTGDNNMETLAFDKTHLRLLTAPKDRDLTSDSVKGIYVFSIDSKKIDKAPTFQIDMEDVLLRRYRKKDIKKTFRPSDLAIHPKTKEIYVLEGVKPKLLILDAVGTVKSVYTLNEKMFPQPEGITFSPDGTLFVSSEGKNDTRGTITELKLHFKNEELEEN